MAIEPITSEGGERWRHSRENWTAICQVCFDLDSCTVRISVLKAPFQHNYSNLLQQPLEVKEEGNQAELHWEVISEGCCHHQKDPFSCQRFCGLLQYSHLEEHSLRGSGGAGWKPWGMTLQQNVAPNSIFRTENYHVLQLKWYWMETNSFNAIHTVYIYVGQNSIANLCLHKLNHISCGDKSVVINEACLRMHPIGNTFIKTILIKIK